MLKGNILDKVLDTIKEIRGIENFDDTKILIHTNDQLPDITLKNDIDYVHYKR